MHKVMRSMKCLAGWVCVLCVLALGCVAVARAAESEVMLVGSTVVRLRGGLPDTTRIPPAMRVTVEHWEPEGVTELYGASDTRSGANAEMGKPPGDTLIPVAQGGLVRLNQERDRLYYTGRTPYGEPMAAGSCDASAAIEVAGRYVASHGGMPLDAEL